MNSWYLPIGTADVLIHFEQLTRTFILEDRGFWDSSCIFCNTIGLQNLWNILCVFCNCISTWLYKHQTLNWGYQWKVNGRPSYLIFISLILLYLICIFYILYINSLGWTYFQIFHCIELIQYFLNLSISKIILIWLQIFFRNVRITWL